MGKYLKIMEEFGLEDIPSLDTAVLAALELFSEEELPEIKIPDGKILVVGSGNAAHAGRIIFRDTDAILGTESSYLDKLPKVDSVVLISASGGKHAPEIAEHSLRVGKKVALFTCNPKPRASFDQIYIFPKNREPYTYNVSTYLGMILSATGENSADVLSFIENEIASRDFSCLGKYDKFFLILPTEFSEIIPMLHIKFKELFGRMIARDIDTLEHMGHATTVVPAKELFISFGTENILWGRVEDRLHIPLPEKPGYAAMMALGYYVIGQIQRWQPPYFAENIDRYTQESSKIFGHEIKPIVE